MNDRAVGLLEQYEIALQRTRKGRGAIICETEQGCMIFKEYTGNVEKLVLQKEILDHVREEGDLFVESIVPTKEGLLYVKDNDGTTYILKTYLQGRECNIFDRTECMDVVKELAVLHNQMEFPTNLFATVPVFSQQKEYERHNKELVRVRKYLRQRSQKTPFEIRLQNSYEYFVDQAKEVALAWGEHAAERAACLEHCTFCHGDYQYHNILRTDQGWFIMNFEKCLRDDPVRDLYLLMRKLLEKTNWSVTLGRELIDAYESERPLSVLSRTDLYYRLAYPEKFWKIVNFYYNSGKAWIPGRNLEKLEKLIAQEKEKHSFLREVFGEQKG